MSERLHCEVFATDLEAADAVARRIAERVRARAAEGRQCVLGLATGHTPIGVYRRLIRMHRREGLDLSNVVTFNLDEYWPMDPQAVQSYRRWMHENFLDHVNVPPANVHIPDGTVRPEQVESFCRDYERTIEQAGGIDLQILGVGRTGHIGFNEPGSSRDSRTRLVRLDRVTRMDAASDFFGESNVPAQAITMGVGTILAAREVALLAFGEHKAPILRRAVEEPPSPQIAASYLQEHPQATLYLDEAAAADLTRKATPWLVGPCAWEAPLVRRAVTWLSRQTGKAVLALTNEDYAENQLGDLLTQRGPAYDINLRVFHALMQTITGWPAGRQPGRRVVVFSPHPDDDVISMGATLRKLCRQGHEVHTVYQTSGNIAVFDHDALRFADFVSEFNAIFGLAPEQTTMIDEHIEQFLRNKAPAAVDSPEVQQIKALIRKTEAITAAGFCGVPRERCHFLDMPFYQTGTVRKKPVGEQDVQAVLGVLEALRPEIVFAAGDLSDPHGTHRMCLEAVFRAMARYVAAGHPRPKVWLYRGAWQEWEPYRIEMAVPISPDELYAKRHAIFRHESQKDRAMFPGPYDAREFWQRAEDRNRGTAAAYDKLGLPEYQGIEAFVSDQGVVLPFVGDDGPEPPGIARA